jgi:GH15 family glucan-1,4-alpha-glucosidase
MAADDKDGGRQAVAIDTLMSLGRNGRVDEARALFERLIGLANDLGLLAEEYDVAGRRQIGNFPQAFSHLTLILAARAISTAGAKVEQAAA